MNLKTQTFTECAEQAHGDTDKFFFRRMLNDLDKFNRLDPMAGALGLTVEDLRQLAEEEEKAYGPLKGEEAWTQAEAARREAEAKIAHAERLEREQAAAELNYDALSKRRADILHSLKNLLPTRKAKLEERRTLFSSEMDWAIGTKGRWLWLLENAQKFSCVDAALSRVPIVEKKLQAELADVEQLMAAMEKGPAARKK